MELPTTIYIGERIGSGADKTTHEVIGYPHLAALCPRWDFTKLRKELDLLNKLNGMGLKTMEEYGIHEIVRPDKSVGTALIAKRYAFSSFDLHFPGPSRKALVNVLNERTASDAHEAMRLYSDLKVTVHDEQFLIGFDGELVLNDPRGMSVGLHGQSYGQLKTILLCVNYAAEVRAGRQPPPDDCEDLEWLARQWSNGERKVA